MSDSVKVAIKLRPSIEQEKAEDSSIEWIIQGNTITSLDPETIKRGNSEFNFGMFNKFSIRILNIFFIVKHFVGLKVYNLFVGFVLGLVIPDLSDYKLNK